MKEVKNFIFCLLVAVMGVFGVTCFIPAVEENEPIVEEKQELIDYVIEKDEIMDVAKLAVNENAFTKKLEVSTSKKFPLIPFDIPGTRNQIVAQIDGRLIVGIDAEKLQFEKEYDSIGNLVTIHVMVPDSEVIYEEVQEEILKQKNGLFNNNPVNVSYYEKKKKELVQQYKDKLAEEKVFEKTDERVQKMITEYLKSITNDEIQIEFSKI